MQGPPVITLKTKTINFLGKYRNHNLQMEKLFRNFYIQKKKNNSLKKSKTYLYEFLKKKNISVVYDSCVFTNAKNGRSDSTPRTLTLAES